MAMPPASPQESASRHLGGYAQPLAVSFGVYVGIAALARPAVEQSVARAGMDDRKVAAYGPFDAIFCRNVLIYFDRETQMAVLRRLTDRLLPGGTLAVGHSEAVHSFDLPLAQIGHTIFRKT